MKKVLVFIMLIAVCSCSKVQKMHGTKTQDIDGFFNFKKYKPTAVEYELTRLGDGYFGPSDFILEAVLYYDATTFTKLRETYKEIDHTVPEKTSKDFNFKWLPKAVKNELVKSPKESIGYPGVALSSNPNCTLWFSNNKVLVYYFTM